MSLAPKIFRGEIWITQNGEHLDPLSDMTGSHLENTIKFIQKPERLEHFKMMVKHEFLSWPSPSGEMAEIAYEESMKEISIILDNLAPKSYFEEHIEPSLLFQRLLRGYFNQTKEKEMPKPVLSTEATIWYETGYVPTNSLYRGQLH